MLKYLKSMYKEITLAGDGRYYSPGFKCQIFCHYHGNQYWINHWIYFTIKRGLKSICNTGAYGSKELLSGTLKGEIQD